MSNGVVNGAVDIEWHDRRTDSGDVKDTFTRMEESPEDARRTAHFLCAHYLGGSWKKARPAQFAMRQITGGMSNLLFLVELNDDVDIENNEQRQALLRIHGESDLDHLLCESVVFTLLSERNLGPRLLGVFPGGRFEQYIPSRPLQCVEISENKLMSKIAPMMARVHALEVPIGKEPAVLKRAKGWINKWASYPASAEPIDMYCTKAEVEKDKYPATVTLDDLRAEINFVENFLRKSQSPIVFSHNDMQEGNILLLDKQSSSKDDEDPELALIDFEYCSYNYRGFDLGNHMCEYGLDYVAEEYPFYQVYRKKLNMKEDERRTFAAAYVDEMYQIREKGCGVVRDMISSNREEDIERVLNESILFMAVSHLFWVPWALLYGHESSIPFGYKEYARDRLALYYERKPLLEKFIENN